MALVLLVPSCSCSKDEPESLGASDMWFKALDFDKSIELVPIPAHESERRVLCAHYDQEGCIEGSGKRIKVRKVELLTIQFEEPGQACEAAKKVGQWYAYAWLFDDVTDEPVLEDFILKVYKAKKADKDTECP
jgi:hypothetical protein